MSSDQYQQLWATLSDSLHESRQLRRNINLEEIESTLANDDIYCIASGDQMGVFKFYFYAREVQSQAFFLVELVVTTANKAVTLLLKSEDNSMNEQFLRAFERASSGFLQA
jgi:glutamate synthase domain-containing protein 1